MPETHTPKATVTSQCIGQNLDVHSPGLTQRQIVVRSSELQCTATDCCAQQQSAAHDNRQRRTVVDSDRMAISCQTETSMSGIDPF